MRQIAYLSFSFLFSSLCAAHWGLQTIWEPIPCAGNSRVYLQPSRYGLSLFIEQVEVDSVTLPMDFLSGASFSKDCATVYLEWQPPYSFQIQMDEWQPQMIAAGAA
jgi:hypothetical protein